MYISSRWIGAIVSRMRWRADTRSPRHASSHARVRSRVATDVATGLSPTSSARCERRRRLDALPEQQVALGDADVGPHQRSVLADLGRRLRHIAEPPDRLVGAAGVAGDLGQRHLEPDPCPDGARGQRPFGGRFEQLPRRAVVPGVGERVGLVDEVLGDAPAGQPVGQAGVVGRRLAGDRSRLVEAPDAQEADRQRAGHLDAGSWRR